MLYSMCHACVSLRQHIEFVRQLLKISCLLVRELLLVIVPRIGADIWGQNQSFLVLLASQYSVIDNTAGISYVQQFKIKSANCNQSYNLRCMTG
jgi:hypothetical protein